MTSNHNRTRCFRAAGVIASTTLVAATSLTSAAPAATPLAAALPAGVRAGDVTQWTTRADQRTEPVSTVIPSVQRATAGTPPTPGTTVYVDPTQKFQTVSGFGASITDSAAANLYRLDETQRAAVLKRLFDPAAGAGISFLRQPIGASDFAVGSAYSYDDMPPGQTDPHLEHFSIAHDEKQIIPLLKQAKALNPQLTVMASPWSPPGWMKTSGSMIDGKLKDDPAIYRAYADYLVKFLQAYRAAGVDVSYLTIQNEPQALLRLDYPGTDLGVGQAAKVVDELAPAIKRAGLPTRILGFDHNWALHWYDAAALQAANGDPEADYPFKLLSTDAARSLYGTAYHCYYGDPAAQTALKASYPGKQIFMTECEGLDIDRAIGSLRNWANSVVAWNIASTRTTAPTSAAARRAPA
ncbi:glycoside hydrolase [Amycolatopsis sp. WQ 127309]|uniref:glycoside hydrolase family 30 protein n=1 Tax=Amycolatopsis sp. WQ 127309 TaxID=2932773 RepID=UPI001FF16315|nr:glycoside hydrolase [Amycolatopsis sp. WQ 127309]UOZ04962.1 hypothetical protein MUY22_40040 [Amycolatopsis sp. WQ 127309]